MFKLLRKIITTGMVTEPWDAGAVGPNFRGQLVVKNEVCTRCTACCSICPVEAIAINGDKLVIDHQACIFCGRCVEVCQDNALKHSANYKLATKPVPSEGSLFKQDVIKVLGRSLAIRHVDAGSCNACDWEMTALTNPIYDLQQYGIDFVASPRHADMLMVTGTVTRNLTQALTMTYEATPTPKLVMAVGSCACSGATYGTSYAIRGGVDSIVPVDIYVPGCPPRPQALLHGLFLALDRLK
jgi:Ni,Fe-hydrogenase III small subunit/Pyruvate/2-oxoacid:ferredoxin oxidoreductase delta subunit